MQCQNERPGENVYPWLMFFLNCLNNIQVQLTKKLNTEGAAAQISPRDKIIYVFIESHPGCQSGEIAEKLNMALPTIKRFYAEMGRERYYSERSGIVGSTITV